MRFKIRQKTIIILFFVAIFPSSFAFGQLKNFGTLAEVKPKPNYTYSAYGYFDLIRESGIGFQYQLTNKYNFDFSCYLINKHVDFSSTIKQWDYYDFKGYGISFKPKYLISKLNRFYIGANIAYENLAHDKVWVEYYWGRGSQIYRNLEGTKGWGYTIGTTIGSMLELNHFLFEPFFGIGITSSKLTKTVYETNQYSPDPKIVYPYSTKSNHSFFQMNIGLKLGFSFKKSKKHQLIDEKFDKIYIPKSNNLKSYFKTIDFRNKTIKKDLRRALARYEALNRNALSKYKRHFNDTTKLYSKIDFLFNRIDSLIISGNK
jgi:hypothetical protein